MAATTFRAFVVNKTESDFTAGIQTLSQNDLPPDGVTIRVAYSSVNYKDGLAAIPNGRVVTKYPMVPGIDLAGTVTASDDPRFQAGDEVIAIGYEIGVGRFGGYAEYARVPADWIVKRPAGLTPREAMAVGTAGFTAGLSVQRLEENGLRPENGRVIVTGATGGVGSTAVSILAQRGYEVSASTGKESEHDFLKEIGATEILSREEVSAESNRPVERERWAGAVDPVGGSTLAYLLRTTKYGGSVANSGLTGGPNLTITVFPFILRGVNLLGIDSVMLPMAIRAPLWERLATDLKPPALSESIAHEVTLEQVPELLATILKGQAKGRAVVRLG